MDRYAYQKDGKWVEINGPISLNRTVNSIQAKIDPESGQPIPGEFDKTSYEDMISFPGNWLASSTARERQDCGIKRILGPASPAANSRVTGKEIIDIGGEPTEVYQVEPLTIAERIDEAVLTLDDVYSNKLDEGYTTTIGGTAQKLQVADFQPYLRIYAAAVQGEPDEDCSIPFRTVSNNNFTLSNAASLSLVNELNSYLTELNQARWDLKEAVRAMTRHAQLDDFDPQQGWPEN